MENYITIHVYNEKKKYLSNNTNTYKFQLSFVVKTLFTSSPTAFLYTKLHLLYLHLKKVLVFVVPDMQK